MPHIYALVCSIANVIEVPDKYLFNVGRLYGSAEAVGLHSQQATYRNLTTSIASFWQAWHSNVRFSKPGPSGSIRVSHIGAPHLAHVGWTISCKSEVD